MAWHRQLCPPCGCLLGSGDSGPHAGSEARRPLTAGAGKGPSLVVLGGSSVARWGLWVGLRGLWLSPAARGHGVWAH